MKHTLLIITLAVLSASLLQRTLRVFHEIPLAGVSEPLTDSLTVETLISGSFRESWEKYLDFTAGFRSPLVRIHNQAGYSLFHLSSNPTLLVGNGRYLYGDIYLDAFTGKDFPGEASITRNVQQISLINHFLQAQGISLLIVIAPNKARLYPEYIPRRILRQVRPSSCYETFRRQTDRIPDLRILDFNRYFERLRDTVSYPLIPKNGIHWSNFTCQTIVPDTLARLICSLRGLPAPELPAPAVYYPDTLLVPDFDLYEILNLYRVQPDESIPYARFITTAIPLLPVRVLTIGDSFFWNLYAHYPWRALYPVNDFWFYGNQRYPSGKYKPVEETSAAQLRQEFLDHDVVILMVAEINLDDLMGFPDQAARWLGLPQDSAP